jgi:hypothetical protein
LVSPWKTPAKKWLIYGTAATLALVALYDKIDKPLQDDVSKDKPLGHMSKLGDYGGQALTNGLYVLGMGAHYWATKKKKSHDKMMVMFLASSYAISASLALKVMAQEPRPNDPHDHASFPSGHTTAAFAFSSTVVMQEGLWPWGVVATSLSVLTGFSRINDNKHYLHDVVGGFTVGTAYGLGISYLYKDRLNRQNRSDESAKSDWNILPVYSNEVKGLVAQYAF